MGKEFLGHPLPIAIIGSKILIEYIDGIVQILSKLYRIVFKPHILYLALSTNKESFL